MVTYADRPWTKHYDPGVPASLEPYPDIPLFELLKRSARANTNKTAVVTSAHLPLLGRVGAELTYAEIDQQSDALGAALTGMGLKKGDRVALVMPNVAAFIIAYFGVLKAGGVVAATNPTYPAERMREQIADCGAEIAIVISLFYKPIKSIQARTSIKTVIVTNVKEYLPSLARPLFALAKEKKTGHYLETLEPGDFWFQDLLKQNAGKQPNVEVRGSDLAIFQYTGGTTGIPKAAMSTHKALVANTMQMRATIFGDKSSDGVEHVFLGAIPFFHVYGLITVVSFAIVLGAKIVLVPNARDIPDLLDVINKFKPTIFMGVPALYSAVNNHTLVKTGKVSLSSVKVCVSGSAPLPPATKREFERLSGGKLLEGFGMSEAPTATHANPRYGENRTGSIGMPLPDVDVQIVSLEDGRTVLPVGEIGELVMSGPQIMIGYHNMPEETEIALKRGTDGKMWLYSGDIARMDEDGYFYVVDRKKDMAIIGGFNVYPSTVEKVLTEHPAVMECGVAAIPHPEKIGQEALKAWIVTHPGQSVTHAQLINFASERLARHEVPTRFAFVESIPRTTVGKTLRRELVQMELDERGLKAADARISLPQE